jgi:hypothetical protein
MLLHPRRCIVVAKEEVLAYAQEAKRQRPQLTNEELRAILKARFVNGKDPLGELAARGMTLGAIASPIDWIFGLAVILRGIGKLWSHKDVSGAMDIIESVIRIEQEPAHGQTK